MLRGADRRREVLRYFRDRAPVIRVPRRLSAMRPRLERATTELSQPLGRAPRLSELAALLDVDLDLVVADTVNTMPEKTLMGFADHGEVEGDKVTGTAAEAQQVFDALERLGVDLTDVFQVLEDEGVEKFETSWKELLDTTKGQMEAAS